MILMKQKALTFLLLIFLIPASVQGIEFRSGDIILIDTPIDDDVFASGSTIIIDAPVKSIIASAGEIEINAPVNGDVIIAGGILSIQADVDGKVIGAGGIINIDSNISTNVMLAGGEVNILEGARIERDAFITAGTLSNAGTIGGVLNVEAETFENTGTANEINFKQQERDSGEGISFFSVLITLGFLILGMLMIRYLPAPFFAVEREIRKDPIKSTLFGFGVAILGLLLILVLTITIIGLPIAFLSGLALMTGILLTSLFVASSFGIVLTARFNMEVSTMIAFILGFILLHIIFAIPIVGFLARIIVIALGLGAIALAANANRDIFTGKTKTNQ
jgi:hypothetical protein